MKKCLTTILAFLYICSSTGATIHMHYCMGQLDNWGLTHNDQKKCGKCGMKKSQKKNTGCCRDIHKYFKTINEQQSVQAGIQIRPLPTLAISTIYPALIANTFFTLKLTNRFSHSPPISPGIAVYIRNCVFLI
jgi:hypothetical protein